MSRMESVLAELDNWKEEEVQQLYQALVQRLMKKHLGTSEKMKNLQKYIGIGRGVWQEDAQKYVSGLRADREI